MQVPMGLESDHEGVIDVVEREAIYFTGDKGVDVVRRPIPVEYVDQCEETRSELIERLADIDDEVAECFVNEEEPSVELIKAAVRRQTIAQKFVPVFMGSAFKNKGVQVLLDGVNDYLPSPVDVSNKCLDLDKEEAEVGLVCDPDAPLVALAFKLEESRFGQLTYLRIYQGTLRKGAYIVNTNSRKKLKAPRLVRMHSNEMEDIDHASAGDVVATFGMDCASMDTFTDGTVNFSMVSMFVPNPVMSLSVRPKNNQLAANFSKAMGTTHKHIMQLSSALCRVTLPLTHQSLPLPIGKFTREDPTLRVFVNEKTSETILSGMGELHLEIYIERMKREYNVECITGNPSVNYKETILSRSKIDYLHKKQSGGSGQYAKIIGYIEPLEDELLKKGVSFEFDNQVVGTNIPPEFIPSCEKGAKLACDKGALAGFPLTGVRVVITDGQAHAVDSNDLSFQLAMLYGIRQGVKGGKPQILEPVMSLEVEAPSEFQGALIGGLNKRGGLIMASDLNDDASQVRSL